MPQIDDPGAAPPLRVRYYPRRVGRGALAGALSPAQALHLADDPERAEQARRTGEPLHLDVAPAPSPPVPASAKPPLRPRAALRTMPVPDDRGRAPGPVRRWIARLTRRG